MFISLGLNSQRKEEKRHGGIWALVLNFDIVTQPFGVLGWAQGVPNWSPWAEKA